MKLFNPFKRIKELEINVLDLETNIVELKSENNIIQGISNRYLEELKELKQKNQLLNNERNILMDLNKRSATDPRQLVESVMDGNIEWFDYNTLDLEERDAYYQNAKAIINNPTFNNIINYLIGEWAEYCLKQAPDYEHVRDMRMQVSALQLLREELASIPNPNNVGTHLNEPHDDVI